MWKIFRFKDPFPERSRIGIEAQSLVHEDSLVSMLSGGYAQPSNLFGKRDCLLVNSVASLMMVGVSPEEVIAQFIYMVADLLREKCGLHGVYQDKGDRRFDEGGPASHQKIPGLPSFHSLTDIIHQILVGASSSRVVKIGVPR